MRKTRKTNGTVRSNITNALYELMAEKPFEHITVTELVDRAQVARVSFYRNFDGMDDVLRQSVRQKAEEWLATVGPDLRKTDPDAYVRSLLTYVYDNREMVDRLFASGRADIVREELNRAFGVGCRDRRESAIRAMFAGGIYNLIHRWSVVRYEPDGEALASFVSELVR